jgi:hypothetical protein
MRKDPSESLTNVKGNFHSNDNEFNFQSVEKVSFLCILE